MSETSNICYIDGKQYRLSEIEAMGYDNFSTSVHSFLLKSIFKYFPNTKQYIKKEKRYRNYSIEALKNNTVFLQDAKNFDDSFDCAIDLDWEKFLYVRLFSYCRCFYVVVRPTDTINDLIYHLSSKLYEYDSYDKTIQAIRQTDVIQKKSTEIFILKLYNDLILQKRQWHEAIINAIKEEYDQFIQCLSKFKISCFSTSPYLNRMWSSSYGNNNQGFCLEYEIDISKEDGRNIYVNMYPVIYSQCRNDLLQLSEHCDLSPNKDDLWQMYFNGLLRKSVLWKDQQEWRLIMLDGLIPQNPIPFFRIKKVFFGNKMPMRERLRIIKYCKKHSIQYVGLVRDTNSFNLIECKGDCCSCTKNSFIP